MKDQYFLVSSMSKSWPPTHAGEMGSPHSLYCSAENGDIISVLEPQSGKSDQHCVGDLFYQLCFVSFFFKEDATIALLP